ncbi:hypothetical protein [Nocardioides sp. 616]|uniref:hypothetical protein n=1 Tax=Nocardioides sp. 616 TaxID=2268090 RepID=UPI000CE4E9FE|nr:hypothetical protein [Nocardioides sp. 616]
MEQPEPQRVRVTGPPRRHGRALRPGTGDIDAGTRVGAILMGSLLAEQRRLAGWVLATLLLTVCSWPLVFHLFPGLSNLRVLGMPLAWLLLGFVVYPLFGGLGWVFVRRAEANERAFSELLAEVLPEGEEP